MEIQIDAHTLERARERGTNEEEIIDVIEAGSVIPSKFGKAQLNRYSEMGMEQEAKEYCKGILKGLYEYERNSSGPFSEYARDIPAEMFGWILDEWKKKNGKKAHHGEMKKFIEKECSDWSKQR